MTESAEIASVIAPPITPTLPAVGVKPGCTASYTWEEIRLYVQRLYAEKQSLRRIANEDFGGRVTHAVIQRILDGQEPKDQRNRSALGLVAYAYVYVVTGGEVPPGAQVVSAMQCECGQWFIPNTPSRRRCFICSPYKKKRKGG